MISVRRCCSDKGNLHRLVRLASCSEVQSASPLLHRCFSSTTTGKGNERTPTRGRRDRQQNLFNIIIPAEVTPIRNLDDINVGAELAGSLKNKREEIGDILGQFAKSQSIAEVGEEYGLNRNLFHHAFLSFRRFCLESDPLPSHLHVVLSDILQGSGRVEDLFPHFYKHSKKVFPHLDCMEDLKKISDLTLPHNWYPEARTITRRIVFHAGPTNSGKTYQAMERFLSSKSGVYCGPLKLLATEVFHKTNDSGVNCDLVTGEERRMNDGLNPASHVACTIEMLNTMNKYEVAIIDEIQMLRDQQRGWAWTRALLGVYAEEVHLCGEAATIELVKEMLYTIGETVEVRNYKRKTSLKIQTGALEKYDRIQDGDCVVAFSKNDIYRISRQIEQKGKQVAVIYGGLPPGTKLAQAKKFNDPADPCKVLVATDAIGMGLNLSIKRVIFHSLYKPTLLESGEKEVDVLSTSQALQIAGRAGRFGTNYEEGSVTTFRKEDLPVLREVLAKGVDRIEQAGLYPTVDQIEMFAYHLPNATLSNLMDLFVSLCQVDESRFFMCSTEDFKFLADMIEHIKLPIKTKYMFCLAPTNRKHPFVCTMFLQIARKYSEGEPLTLDWLCRNIGFPFATPKTIIDLIHLEGVFDVLDLYLWLGYRFVDMFPDMELVRDLQKELDFIIQQGVLNITRLLKSVESPYSTRISEIDPDYQDFQMKRKNEILLKKEQQADEQSETGVSRTAVAKDSRKKGEDMGATSPVRLRGSLTNRLLDQGILTPKMLDQLRNEMQQQPGGNVPSPKGRKPRR